MRRTTTRTRTFGASLESSGCPLGVLCGSSLCPRGALVEDSVVLMGLGCILGRSGGLLGDLSGALEGF
eukprot:9462111-Pyramimonas_sp.AAC.1